MTDIQPGRTTHEHDGPIGVFLIGMRFNQLRRPDQWLPVLLAMPRMLTELYRNRATADRGEAADLGFLGARTLFGSRGVTVVQYWRSVEDIYRYASAQDHEHRPAWTAFNARARKARGVVGIWHETYAVPAGAHESVYVGTPVMGLAAATTSAPMPSRKSYARLTSAGADAGAPASVAQ
ncbi:MAG TPA: DUF4188 domain-containing protein [Lapillicoccus sp.]|jgi:hypothetical protein|nr:DUF4188 domain-containing protein [Lapillicoccus sp.]